ncbi:hypothetical protein HK097_001511 [Rhizophlyctis rosea]|uniref:Ceramide glucosyltransferase n=1 Tax=Rhizophlyctis rosea TaxID=64517 RepID=A0AAD5SMM2_9FUNG|nr:hypothetical protein HK097_001511 [Rhizophlyctis rosea]
MAASVIFTEGVQPLRKYSDQNRNSARLSLNLSGIDSSRSRYGSKKSPPKASAQSEQLPGVTILRPLKGVEVDLVKNLTCSLRQEYPLFEVIFCVAQEGDPSIPIVQDLMKQFPDVDTKLLIGETEVGVNPKINNLIRGYETAKHDIIWILDSNVSIPSPTALLSSVRALLSPRIGLVHHLPVGIVPTSNGSLLERTFLNTAHAKMYLTINKIAIASCIIGKSNMFRRSDLKAVGGLRHFGKYMCEDNIIGEYIWGLGLRHKMTGDLALQSLGDSLTVWDYIKRRARWIRIRKYTVTAATLAEPFSESLVCGFWAAWAFYRTLGVPVWKFLPVHFGVWFAFDYFISSTLDPSVLKQPVRYFLSWVVRECLALPVWGLAMWGTVVEWRGRDFNLRRDGTVDLATNKVQHHGGRWASLLPFVRTRSPVRRKESSGKLDDPASEVEPLISVGTNNGSENAPHNRRSRPSPVVGPTNGENVSTKEESVSPVSLGPSVAMHKI